MSKVDVRIPLSIAEKDGMTSRQNEAATTAYGMGRVALDVIMKSTDYSPKGEIHFGGEYFRGVETMSVSNHSNLVQMGYQNGGRY